LGAQPPRFDTRVSDRYDHEIAPLGKRLRIKIKAKQARPLAHVGFERGLRPFVLEGALIDTTQLDRQFLLLQDRQRQLLGSSCWTAVGQLLDSSCWTAVGQLLLDSCWTAVGQLLLDSSCWTAVGQLLLDSCVGQLLDSCVGQLCWTAVLDSCVGQLCWTAVGQLCWTAVLDSCVGQLC
jgi:hypothetical protein